jgi:hypothetical protein
MNIAKAYHTLGITCSPGDATPEEIKTQYRLGALKYHPDKCRDADAADKFREIQEAYEYLTKQTSANADGGDNTYKTMVGSFLSKLFFQANSGVSAEDGWKEEICRLVVSRLVGLCESKALEYIEKIDRKTLAKLQTFLVMYREALHLSDTLIARVDELLAKPPAETLVILLNPFLEDLQEDNLYRITESGKTFIVPLWHHELVYDNSGVDFVVRCCPVLPEHMEIDEYNNIYVYLSYRVSELWGKNEIEVPFGKRVLYFWPKQLSVSTQPQQIRFPREGIASVNLANPVDNSVRKDVVLVIQLTGI